MRSDDRRAPARRPEDLSRLFLERANAGDVDGLVALYEPTAVLAVPTLTAGRQRPPLVAGDVAFTSTRLLDGGATAEVARRQPDGSWLWGADQPNILG